MPATLLKGSEVGKRLLPRLKEEAAQAAKLIGHRPSLALVQIGHAPDAELYAKAIRRILVEIGAGLLEISFEAAETELHIAAEIRRAAENNDVNGILILTPLPNHLNHAKLNEAIPAYKDVEGARGTGEFGVWPPTALSIDELVVAGAGTASLAGKHAVIIGRSRTVGFPAARLLLQRDATITVCHSKTPNLQEYVRQADIVVAAAGKPCLVKGSWLKEGAVVVDAGENVVGSKLLGDVGFDSAAARAGFLTPVPAGVGPLTTYMLIRNLLSLCRNR